MNDDFQRYVLDGSSQYEASANVFTVIDIARPVPVIAPTELIYDAWEALMLDEEEYALVKDNNKTYGYLRMFGADGAAFHEIYIDVRADSKETDYWTEKQVIDIAEPILPYQLVAPSLTILELVPQFLEEDFLFVLEEDAVSHMVTYEDLDKFPVKLCFFSIIMRIDDALLYLLTQVKDIEKYYLKLPEEIREVIERQAKKNYKGKDKNNVPIEYKLKYTNLEQKYQFFMGNQKVKKFFGRKDIVSLNNTFKKIKSIRNLIAHGDSFTYELSTTQEYIIFYKSLVTVYDFLKSLKTLLNKS